MLLILSKVRISFRLRSSSSTEWYEQNLPMPARPKKAEVFSRPTNDPHARAELCLKPALEPLKDERIARVR